MFSKSTLLSLALAAVAVASPLPRPVARAPVAAPVARRGSGPQSINWGGISSSLTGFENFYGSGNFDNSNNKQVIVKDKEVVCQSVEVKIVQQRLAVIHEIAKKVITELSCDVETQTVVWQQFYASMGNFGYDLSRSSNNQVGYDYNVVQNWGDIINSDGSCSTNDFGWSGSDIGSNTICPSGNNWNDQTSPSSVGYAQYECGKAIWQTQYYGGYSSQDCVVESSGSDSYNYNTVTIDGNYYTYSDEVSYNTYDNYNTYDDSYSTAIVYSTDDSYYNTYTTDDSSYNTYTTDGSYSYNTYSADNSSCSDCASSTIASFSSVATDSSCSDCAGSTIASFSSVATDSASASASASGSASASTITAAPPRRRRV